MWPKSAGISPRTKPSIRSAQKPASRPVVSSSKICEGSNVSTVSIRQTSRASASAFSRIFSWGYFRWASRFFQLIGTAAENHDPVAREQVGNVPLHEPVHGSEFPRPAIRVNDLGVPFLVIADNVRPDRGSEVDDLMPAVSEFLANQGFSGTGCSRDAAHHNAFIPCTNRSFSQSSPMLTRM